MLMAGGLSGEWVQLPEKRRLMLCLSGYRYNGGEGFVPGAMFRKFDKRQATLYVKKVSWRTRPHNEIMCVIFY